MIECVKGLDDAEYWYLGNLLHRRDGPAIDFSKASILYPNGKNEWWLRGNRLFKEWFIARPDKITKMKAWELFTPDEIVKMRLYVRARLLIDSGHSDAWIRFVHAYPIVDIKPGDCNPTYYWVLAGEYKMFYHNAISKPASQSLYLRLYEHEDFEFDIGEIVRARFS